MEFIAGALIGLIVGVLWAASASDRVMTNRIKAGVFEHDSVGYKIEKVEK